MRRGENSTPRRRQGVRQRGVEPEQSMRMSGPEKHGPTPFRYLPQPIGEGVQRGQSPLRIDHIMPGSVRRVGRNPTLVRHQPDQVPLPPRPFGIESDQHPGIPGREGPITPQALLPRGRHGSGQPGGQQMGAEGAGGQHGSDADGPGTPARRKPRKRRAVGVTPVTER